MTPFGGWSHSFVGLQVVERPDLRRGLVYATGLYLIVGTKPPTEVEQLVMDGFVAAHPWFRDPLRADPIAALRGLAQSAD